jgi:pimeloyl-ACP methyl ester carboxylesterase
MTPSAYPPRPARRESVIALHCSGAGAAEWSPLVAALGDGCDVMTPEHYGGDSRGPWTGAHAFTLADEAAETLALIDKSSSKVHLVGHSYGGGVALHAALARPDRIASMALYEPSAFHLLRQMGDMDLEGHAEIVVVAQRIGQALLTGDYRAGVAAFVDYWNGPGAWAAMRPTAQDTLVRWAPKAPLDFHALIGNPTPAHAYRTITCPVLILRGERAPRPTRLIAEHLPQLLPASELVVVADAGHMGPFTHAPEVARLIAQHIRAAAPDESRTRTRPRLVAALGA